MGEASEAAVALHAGGEDDGGATGGCWVSGSTGSAAAAAGIGTASSGGGRRRCGVVVPIGVSSSLLVLVVLVFVVVLDAVRVGSVADGRGRRRVALWDVDDSGSSPFSQDRAIQVLPGGSKSFTSLADVICVEDLTKKTTPYISVTDANTSDAVPEPELSEDAGDQEETEASDAPRAGRRSRKPNTRITGPDWM
ncbi:uncharacterized protein [Miscanthus floridulus]|uniref:uncharacterized protein n=1 Tax=Miscanthus floridulus TaxID=154761 RepID=UPI0034597DB8